MYLSINCYGGSILKGYLLIYRLLKIFNISFMTRQHNPDYHAVFVHVAENIKTNLKMFFSSS